MAQAIFETIFDMLYLGGVITAGILMVRGSGNNALVKKFGIMAMVLGLGDAFHLVPRAWALWTTGMEANAAALGVGKLITSITMAVFYLILYYVWRERYGIQGRKSLTVTMWALLVARVALSLLPQNEWLRYDQPLFFGVLRNIPFAITGVLMIVIFAQEAAKAKDLAFKNMWVAILLSFGFYVPVVLFSAALPMIGMLMIPKTLAYVWIVWMGWRLFQQSKKMEV